MNKADLVAELADRLDGDKQAAAAALENTLDIIVRAIAEGESITIMGFGIFERRERAPRVARNPHTGVAVPVEATAVPSFRPARYFKDIVSGARPLPEDGLVARRGSSHEAFGADDGS